MESLGWDAGMLAIADVTVCRHLFVLSFLDGVCYWQGGYFSWIVIGIVGTWNQGIMDGLQLLSEGINQVVSSHRER
jgi:hypothetical protein